LHIFLGSSERQI
jgi:hypothetical protein